MKNNPESSQKFLDEIMRDDVAMKLQQNSENKNKASLSESN